MTTPTEACCADPKCDGASCKPKPLQPHLMTMDDARVSVARMLNNILSKSAAEVTAALEVDPDKESNAYQNGARMVLAAQEFMKGNDILIKRLTTPRILRPVRSAKVFRG
jgi:hypothetical protein